MGPIYKAYTGIPLWLYKRLIFGDIKNKELLSIKDINMHESFILVSLLIPIILFGVYPETLLNTVEVSINSLIENYQIALNSK